MNIRASMLPDYTDCSRRAASKQFRKEFERLGIEFRSTVFGTAAAIGTAGHKGGELLMTAKWSHRNVQPQDVEEEAIEGFKEEIKDGAEWGDKIPNANAAIKIIQALITAYHKGPYQTEMPATVNDAPGLELSLKADAGDGWLLTGHPDLYTDQCVVWDTKMGGQLNPYYAQLGANSLLLRSSGLEVNGCGLHFIQRPTVKNLFTECQPVVYPLAASEAMAMAVINRIKADMGAFRETVTDSRPQGDPNVFMCNLSSHLCSERFCPAFGTAFCELSGGL